MQTGKKQSGRAQRGAETAKAAMGEAGSTTSCEALHSGVPVRSDDRATTERLIRREWSCLMAFARDLVASATFRPLPEPKELVMDAVTKLLAGARTWNNGVHWRNAVLLRVEREFIDCARRARALKRGGGRGPAAFDVDRVEIASNRDEYARPCGEETSLRIKQQVEKFTPVTREAVRQRYAEDKSAEGIAESINDGAVRLPPGERTSAYKINKKLQVAVEVLRRTAGR